MRHTAWYHLDTARLGLCTTLATELKQLRAVNLNIFVVAMRQL